MADGNELCYASGAFAVPGAESVEQGGLEAVLKGSGRPVGTQGTSPRNHQALRHERPRYRGVGNLAAHYRGPRLVISQTFGPQAPVGIRKP